MKDTSVIKRFKQLIKSKDSKRNFLGSMTTQGSFNFLWRPNNYRRQVKISLVGVSIDKKAIAKQFFGTVNSQNNVLSLKSYYPNITLQLGTNSLVAIWSQNFINGEKESFLCSSNDLNWVCDKKVWIEGVMDNCIADFISRYKLFVVGEPFWSRYEDAVKGESILDALPNKDVIHGVGWKKVYDDWVEFTGGFGDVPTLRMINFINIRCRELFKVDYSDVVSWAEDYIKELDDVFVYEKYISGFSKGNKDLLSNFLFERFGGVKVV